MHWKLSALPKQQRKRCDNQRPPIPRPAPDTRPAAMWTPQASANAESRRVVIEACLIALSMEFCCRVCCIICFNCLKLPDSVPGTCLFAESLQQSNHLHKAGAHAQEKPHQRKPRRGMPALVQPIAQPCPQSCRDGQHQTDAGKGTHPAHPSGSFPCHIHSLFFA